MVSLTQRYVEGDLKFGGGGKKKFCNKIFVVQQQEQIFLCALKHEVPGNNEQQPQPGAKHTQYEGKIPQTSQNCSIL